MKKKNEYALLIDGHDYEQTPKAVYAAMAVSFASCGGDHLEGIQDKLRHEWHALYNAGIVPQKPPFPCPDIV